MLLAVDVGNTETTLGCFAAWESQLAQAWRIRTDSKRTADELGALFVQLFGTASLRPEDVDAIVVASVVPNLDQTLEEACSRYFNCPPVFFKAHRQTLMR